MNKSVNPTFSIVMPLHRQATNIQRAIESVESQTYENYELLIVYPSSRHVGDSNLHKVLLNTVSARGDARIIHQNNHRAGASWRRGVEEARGNIVAFLDADDFWEPHFLAEVASLAQEFSVASAYATGYQYVLSENEYSDPKIRSLGAMNAPRILQDFFNIGAQGDLPFTLSSFCIRKELLNRMDGFPDTEYGKPDQDLFIRSALLSKIAYDPSVLCFQRLTSEDTTPDFGIASSETSFLTRLKNYADRETNDATRKALLKYAVSHLFRLVSLNVRQAKYGVANTLLNDAYCKMQPLRYLWWRTRCQLALRIDEMAKFE